MTGPTSGIKALKSDRAKEFIATKRKETRMSEELLAVLGDLWQYGGGIYSVHADGTITYIPYKDVFKEQK